MKVMYIGQDDYMARIKTGDVFDVFDCPVNEYGEVTCYVIINAAGEHIFLELGECVVI
ncbi:hypothetical protein BvCms16BK_04538 [Escherichia coli]|nr:hypothetical protein BvCms16BK_04538 [Escherichia coli]